MANKYDIQTWYCSALASQGTTHIGDSIATGKTRFITFLSVYKDGVIATVGQMATGAYIQVGSVATAAATATEVSTGLKFAINIPHTTALGSSPVIMDEYQKVDAPEEPNFDHPLFAITGAGNFVGVVNRSGGTAHVTNSAATVQMFAQYYDE